MPRLRATLLAVGLLTVGLPALASAAPQDCLTPGFKAAVCSLDEAGSAAQQVEAPLIAPRDATRTATDAALVRAGICDGTDPAACLLPFPSDFFTRADPTTPTGRRLAISPLAMPRNVGNRPIDPTELNRNDGWSPGTPILASVPGLDVSRSAIAGVTDPAASLAPGAPIVVVDATTGERHPYAAELDAHPTNGEQPLLIVRPMVNFTDGHRYVIGLRHLVTASGAEIAPNPVFAARRAAASPTDRIFGPLARAGVAATDLFLAWDFTIASTQNTTGRMIHIRDDAFTSLRGAAPSFTVGAVTDAYSGQVSRRITGTFSVPNYLNTPVNAQDPVLGIDPGLPGTRFLYLPGSDLPARNGSFTATYTCDVPTSTVSSFTDPTAVVHPARAATYGHGLLGGQGEVGAGNVQRMGDENNIVFCATDWYGMATGDIAHVAASLADMSNFPTLPDRVQQGMLAQLFLSRLLKDPRGFASAGAFRLGGRPVHQTGAVYYDGNSQGGIIGGALVAVSQDITRAALGVPGMNYSTLLDRSSDFATYKGILDSAYPSQIDRELVYGVIQPLWDRAENNGYAAHLTHDLLPGTPAHQVLMHPAYGDHQVANLSAEVMARTIGAHTNSGFLATGRHWGVQPGWGLPRFTGSYDGSGFVYWDSGTASAPDANLPPAVGSTGPQHDPHEDPRATYLARVQKSLFLRPGGTVVDVCNGAPCLGRPLGPETR